MKKRPRVSVRALIIHNDRLLLVNATAEKGDDRWCTPGGGLEHTEAITPALEREVYEETGLTVSVGDLKALSEYCDYDTDFHQIDLYFQCTILEGTLNHNWKDVAEIVDKRKFFTLEEMNHYHIVPDFLTSGCWLHESNDVSVFKGREEKGRNS